MDWNIKALLVVGLLVCQSAHALEAELRAEDRLAIEGAFQTGRISAAGAARAWKPCASRPSEPSIVGWLQRYQNQLVQDIEYSQHHWITDVQPNCAFTQAQPLSPIYLSYSTCRDQVATDVAAKHLLRKSIQHYGEIDSVRIEQIVSEIYAGQYSCPPFGDRFNISYCPGQALTNKEIVAKMRPGETRVDVTGINPELFMRSRVCNRLTGCKDWIETDLLREYYDGNLLAGDVFRNGKLSLIMTYPPPSIWSQLDFDGFKLWSTSSFQGLVESSDVKNRYFVSKDLGSFSGMFTKWRTTEGKLSNSCIYMTQRWATSDSLVGTYTEYQYVMTGRLSF